MSTPPPPSWNTPQGQQPGSGWGPPPGQQTWGQQPGQQVWGTGAASQPGRTPVVLWTGIAAVLLMVVAAATGLYALEFPGADFRQQFGVFTLSYSGDTSPTGYLRTEGLTLVLGLMAWVAGAAVARIAPHRVPGLAVCAAGAAVVLAYTVDFWTAQVYGAVVGQGDTTTLLTGAYALLVLLLVSGASLVLALVALTRAARSRR